MTTTDAMHAAFLADILAHPADDFPRKVYADWLRDRDLWTWPHLRDLMYAHPASDGVRLLAADWFEAQGQGKRAEFVRAQLTLTRDFGSGHQRRYYQEVRCAAKLHPAGASGACGRCEPCRMNTLTLRFPVENPAWPDGQWRTWHGGKCVVRSSTEPNSPRTILDYHRGFVRDAQVSLAAFLQHGPAIAAAHPIAQVRLTDREPYAIVPGHAYLWFAYDEDDGEGDNLPEEWFENKLPPREFSTPDAAHAWASERAILWARGLLPAG